MNGIIVKSCEKKNCWKEKWKQNKMEIMAEEIISEIQLIKSDESF